MRKFFGLGSSTPSSSETKSPLVGRWKEPRGSDVTEFRADGTVTEKPSTGGNIRGRYSLAGSKLKINLDGVPETLLFTVALKGDTLEMTGPDGETTRYGRIS